MNTTSNSLSRSFIIFQVFKFIVYGLLTYNVYIFFLGEVTASAQVFSNGIELSDFILAFSATIDSTAWIILVIVFELETLVLSDETLKGPTMWVLLLLKIISYAFIFYSAYGYVAKLLYISDTSVFNIADVCTLVGTSYTYVVTLDGYEAITDSVCQLMNNVPLFQINGTEIIATKAGLTGAERLAWVDIINSADWLLIVGILEVDIYLQLHDKLTGRIYKLSQIIKPLLYFILFINAVYWGFEGDFVDFWDAALWLLAFFFIELNVFQWHEETEDIP